MRKLNRKTVAIAAGAMLLLSGTGVAYAYWTNSGTGSGTATTGTNVGITVNQTSAMDATKLVPGGGTQALSGTFTNTNAGPVWIKTVIATVTKTEKPVGTPNLGCTAADYTIGGTSVVQGAAAGNGAQVPVTGGTWSGLTIAFNSTAANQDACKDAVVTIGYTTTATN
jgi:hypothetical protein